VQSSTFTFRNTAELLDYQQGRYGSYEYGRYGNPTTRVCEEKVRALEGAEVRWRWSSSADALRLHLNAFWHAHGVV
jgi:cystathionine beta-lyase/cystathionine gamma-synthase